MRYYFSLVFVFVWAGIVFILGTPVYLLAWGSRKLSPFFGRLLSWPILKALGIRVELQGTENLGLNQPCVYVANHQSAFEVILVGHFIPEGTVIIGKKQIQWVPFFGLFFVAAGNILIDRRKGGSALSVLSLVVETMKTRHASVLIFPEGTRNNERHVLLPFKRGAFQMAIAAQTPIVPIVFSSIHSVWDAKSRTAQKGSVTIKVLPPIETKGMTKEDIDSLSSRVRTQMEATIASFSFR